MSVSLEKSEEYLFITDSENWNKRQHQAMLARTQRVELNRWPITFPQRALVRLAVRYR